MTGGFFDKTIVKEVLLILLMAVALGTLWNQTLILDVWRGKSLPQQIETPVNNDVASIPLPLGIMQVKDFFDQKEAVFIDARGEVEYRQGHIPRAISIPLAKAGQGLALLDKRIAKNTLIVVYCNGFDCHDSLTVGELLLKNGFTAVFAYGGGFPEWRDTGYPVTIGSHEE